MYAFVHFSVKKIPQFSPFPHRNLWYPLKKRLSRTRVLYVKKAYTYHFKKQHWKAKTLSISIRKKKKRQNKLSSFLSWLKLSIWRLLTDCFSPCLWDETRAYSNPWQANCCLSYNLTFGLLVKTTFPWHGFVKLSFPFCNLKIGHDVPANSSKSLAENKLATSLILCGCERWILDVSGKGDFPGQCLVTWSLLKWQSLSGGVCGFSSDLSLMA